MFQEDISQNPGIDALHSRAGHLITGGWSLPSVPGVTVSGPSSLSATNGSEGAVVVRFGDFEAALPAGGLLTLPLDPFGQEVVRFEGASGAGGTWVQHDKTFNWMVAGTSSPFPFRGPIQIAVLSHPRSEGPVEIEAAGQSLGSVEPGRARLIDLNDEQARSLTLSSRRNVEGVFATPALL